jgi:hypothetical protein
MIADFLYNTREQNIGETDDSHPYRPNLEIKWVMLLLHILQVAYSNLGSETCYPQFEMFIVFLGRSTEFPEKCLQLCHSCFIPHPFQVIVRQSDSNWMRVT